MSKNFNRIRKNTRRGFAKFLKSLRRKDKIYNRAVKYNILKHSGAENERRLFECRKSHFFEKFKPFIDFTLDDEENIIFPKEFSLLNNFKESFDCIKKVSTYFYLGKGEIKLDFENCKIVDVAAIFLLQILKKEFSLKCQEFDNKCKYLSINPKIYWLRSKSLEVNRIMISCGFPKYEHKDELPDKDTIFHPQSTLGYFKGNSKQSAMQENKKGICSKAVVDYVNNCLKHHSYQLTMRAQGYFDGIIGEVLSNCEDHSTNNTWFVHANFSTTFSDLEEMVGELNLTILNFGESIYESFLLKKHCNEKLFDGMERRYNDIKSKSDIGDLDFEQFLVLYLMTEGMSRLSYEDPSRGTGTIKFLNSFIELSDYNNYDSGIYPLLSILSGKTNLICDNVHKPFLTEGNIYLLSLNSERTLELPPALSHLKKVKEGFPGTLISTKIYFNKKHLDSKSN